MFDVQKILPYFLEEEPSNLEEPDNEEDAVRESDGAEKKDEFTYDYTLDDLNISVNDEETLLQFIRSTEELYKLAEANLDELNEESFNKYIRFLDDLYEM